MKYFLTQALRRLRFSNADVHLGEQKTNMTHRYQTKLYSVILVIGLSFSATMSPSTLTTVSAAKTNTNTTKKGSTTSASKPATRKQLKADLKKLRLSKTTLTFKKKGEVQTIKLLPASARAHKWKIKTVTTSNKAGITVFGKTSKSFKVKAKKAGATVKIKAVIKNSDYPKTVTLLAKGKVKPATSTTDSTKDPVTETTNDPVIVEENPTQPEEPVIPEIPKEPQKPVINQPSYQPYYPPSSYYPPYSKPSENYPDKKPSNPDTSPKPDEPNPAPDQPNIPPAQEQPDQQPEQPEQPDITTPAAIEIDQSGWNFTNESLSFDYDGKAHQPVMTGVQDFVQLEYTFTNSANEVVEQCIDAGIYHCEVRGATTSEYAPPKPMSTQFEIKAVPVNIAYEFDANADQMRVKTGVVMADCTTFSTTLNEEACTDPSLVDFSTAIPGTYTLHTQIEIDPARAQNYLLDENTELAKTALFELRSENAWFTISVTPYQPDNQTLRFDLTLENAHFPQEGSDVVLNARVIFDKNRLQPKNLQYGILADLIGNNGWRGNYLPTNQNLMNITTRYSYDDYGPLDPNQKYGLGSIEYTITDKDASNLIWQIDNLRINNSFYTDYPFDFYANPITVMVNRTTPSEFDLYPVEKLVSQRSLISNSVYTDRLPSGTINLDTALQNLQNYLNS